MSTPHNAGNKGDFAKTVLMPGDPLRAKYIAEHYLEDVKEVTTVRNMFGYTGTYKGKSVSVMGSGMGMPSIGIYCHELFNFYDVDNIIRIGSAGSMQPDVKCRDIIIAQGVSTNSNWAVQYNLPGTFSPLSDFELVYKAVQNAEKLGLNYKVGNVLSSDHFYNADSTTNERWAKMGILCAEMESAALLMEAAYAHKKALSLLTISDEMLTGIELTAEERQTTFNDMMELALSLV